MSGKSAMPEPIGDYENHFYDIARWVPEEDDFALEDYSPAHFRTGADAVARAAQLNADRAERMGEDYGMDLYAAVRVDQRVAFRLVEESDR